MNTVAFDMITNTCRHLMNWIDTIVKRVDLQENRTNKIVVRLNALEDWAAEMGPPYPMQVQEADAVVEPHLDTPFGS